MAEFEAVRTARPEVQTAYAALVDVYGESSNSPKAFYANVDLVDALKKAKVPEVDAKDMVRIVVDQQVERGR